MIPVTVLIVLLLQAVHLISFSTHSFSMGPFDPIPPPPPLSSSNMRLAQRVSLGLDADILQQPFSFSSNNARNRLFPLQATEQKPSAFLEPKVELKRKLLSEKMDAMTLNQINDHWKYYESLCIPFFEYIHSFVFLFVFFQS